MDTAGGGLYAAPAIYDILALPGTADELDAYVRIERAYATRCGPGTRWLEPACGTGRLLRGAARRGRMVAGYDREPAMIDYTRRRLGPDAPLRLADLAAPAATLRDLGRCDLAVCPWNTLRHLPSDAALLAHLTQVASMLVRGGVYVVGLSFQDFGWNGDDEDTWVGARGSLRVTQVVNYLPSRGRRERVVSHLMITRPRGVEHLDHVYDLRTYTQAQWLRVLARSPLRRLATCDIFGRPVGEDAPHPYRLEVLGR